MNRNMISSDLKVYYWYKSNESLILRPPQDRGRQREKVKIRDSRTPSGGTVSEDSDSGVFNSQIRDKRRRSGTWP